MEPGRHLAPCRVRALNVSSNLTSSAKLSIIKEGGHMSFPDWLDGDDAITFD